MLALAKRQSLDQKKKQAEDAGARTRLISHAIAETDQAVAQESDFRLAAYNILGSKAAPWARAASCGSSPARPIRRCWTRPSA